mmetsp:Transcript_2072/g.2333  ORF Transcript_2072/g.2333 Transcript_2072/m.2333 type:complete len:278 (+) Transcript_2072:499-1332(+)
MYQSVWVLYLSVSAITVTVSRRVCMYATVSSIVVQIHVLYIQDMNRKKLTRYDDVDDDDDDVLLEDSSSSSSLILCSYAWMVGKGTGINTVQELQRVLAPVWVVTTNSSTSTTTDESSGWKVTGYPVRTPRTGWYADTANATFELRVPILVPTHTLTIVSMKSYGPTWIGSKLAVTVTIRRASSSSENKNNNKNNSTTTNSTTTTTSTSPLDDLDNHDTTATYEIDGFHDIQTSVHFPHKFPLPGKDGAAVGDEVIVRARLIGGSTFKINGLALCRF